jgi:hypothetical protein
MLLEGLGQLKKSNDLIGNRTRYRQDCSIVPQNVLISIRNALAYGLQRISSLVAGLYQRVGTI